jgi:hypothetical protein
MTKGKWQTHLDGKLASACHLRRQLKIEVLQGFEGQLPPLPSLFLKKRKMRNTAPLKSLSKVVAMVASAPTLTLASIQMDCTLPQEVTL